MEMLRVVIRVMCGQALGMRATLLRAQERVLTHLRHLHQLAVCAHEVLSLLALLVQKYKH